MIDDEYEFEIPEAVREFLKDRARKDNSFKEYLGTHAYILENGKVKPADFMEMGGFFADIDQRRIDLTRINDEIEVSTVFLGIDHNWSGEGGPILFETIIFGGPRDSEMRRYRTMREAKEGHWKIVEELRRESL